jgi:hypothetical protein
MAEKTWQFDMNRPYAPNSANSTVADDLCKYVLWYYKTFLCGQIGGATQGLWTVYGSSDAVTAGLDQVDRWTNVYTNGKLTHAAAGALHSWVVLKSPVIVGKNYYLLLDYNILATGYQVAITLGTTAPTGGSATTVPTFVNSYTQAAQTFGLNAAWGPTHLHGMLATDGSFIILSSRDYTGAFFSGFVGTLLANYKAADTTPFWVNMSGDPTALVTTGFGNGIYGLDSSGNMRHLDDTGAAAGYGGILPVNTGSSPTNNFPAAPDPWDGGFVDFPVWVGSNTAGFKTIRGRIQDVLFHGGIAPSTGCVDSYVAPTMMTVGKYWFPTNAIPVL